MIEIAMERRHEETDEEYDARKTEALAIVTTLPRPYRAPGLLEAYDPARHLPPGVSVRL